MSNAAIRQANRRRTHRRQWLAAVGALFAIGAGTAAAVVLASGPSDSGGRKIERTGEVNAMGLPVIATSGSADGVAVAAGLTATPASWALGRVPLDVAVRPTWHLSNSGDEVVTIGEPHVQINLGCCPGAFSVNGPSTLNPADSTDLGFELAMHPGMDGPHDMTIHVPVQHADGSIETLTLGVSGDFRD